LARTTAISRANRLELRSELQSVDRLDEPCTHHLHKRLAMRRRRPRLSRAYDSAAITPCSTAAAPLGFTVGCNVTLETGGDGDGVLTVSSYELKHEGRTTKSPVTTRAKSCGPTGTLKASTVSSNLPCEGCGITTCTPTCQTTQPPGKADDTRRRAGGRLLVQHC
jgi:hypothetical protein